MKRRTFLETAIVTALGTALPAQEVRPRRILLRSSWQTVNIGDIAHTPGVLTLLERHLPDVETWLWPSDVDSGVEQMLLSRFPKLKIVQGKAAIEHAMRQCEFLLHGSGPSLVAASDVARWNDQTGKPYGVFGITVASVDHRLRDLLSSAQFVFFRDSVSLKLARERDVKCPIMAFGPDGAFAVDLRNDAAAERFLRDHDLSPGKFLCCIPRLRYTPYWKIKNRPFDEKKHARSEEMKEHDHAPLRDAITVVIRETDMKVLLCPEDQSQMAVGKEMLLDKLPEDVKAKVVWREKYWLTDEALSTYVRSAGLFGLEMHSPIMCIGNGVPAIVCRFEEQTSKGFMWRDIGLGDWLFDMDQKDDVNRLAPTVLAMAKDPAAARAIAEEARAKVQKLQREMVETLSSEITG